MPTHRAGWHPPQTPRQTLSSSRARPRSPSLSQCWANFLAHRRGFSLLRRNWRRGRASRSLSTPLESTSSWRKCHRSTASGLKDSSESSAGGGEATSRTVEVGELTAGELEGGVFDGLMGRDKDSEESSDPSLKYRPVFHCILLKLPEDWTVSQNKNMQQITSHTSLALRQIGFKDYLYLLCSEWGWQKNIIINQQCEISFQTAGVGDSVSSRHLQTPVIRFLHLLTKRCWVFYTMTKYKRQHLSFAILSELVKYQISRTTQWKTKWQIFSSVYREQRRSV